MWGFAGGVYGLGGGVFFAHPKGTKSGSQITRMPTNNKRSRRVLFATFFDAAARPQSPYRGPKLHPHSFRTGARAPDTGWLQLAHLLIGTLRLQASETARQALYASDVGERAQPSPTARTHTHTVALV